MCEVLIKNKIFIKEKMFLTSLFLLIFMYVFRLSVGLSIPYYHHMLMMLRLLAYALVGIKFILDLLDKKFSLKELLFISFIGLFLLLISYQSRTIAYFVYFVYIVASRNIDYIKIIKIAFYAHLIAMILIFLFSITGVMRDIVYFKDIRDRHSLGYSWCTNLPNLFMYLVLYYIYIRKEKMMIYEYIIIIALDLIIFLYTDTKSAFSFTLFSILLIFIINHIKFFNAYKTWYKYVLFIIIIFLPLFIISVSAIYDEKVMILSKLNSILSGRLQLGNNAFSTYGVSFFAKQIAMQGGEVSMADGYNFVDSSFVKMLINFGYIFFLLMMSYITYFAYKIDKRKDIYLMVCFIIFLLHSTFDPQLFHIEMNNFFIIGGL